MPVSSIVHLKPTQFAPDVGSPQAAERDESVPSETTYLPGEVVADRYRLVRELGRGGMGVVWEARSLALEVNVALKLIRSSAGESEAASRMAREAHAAARLAHPSLVRVFDFGWSNRGHPFLVMELVNGETLAHLLSRETRVGPIRAVQMLLPVADGLRCAHEKGIVHRDIKPENLLISNDSFGRLQPKLLDFGIARLKQLPTEHRLTQAGVVMGSPAYMSPEQARGDEDVDVHSDVWSMCVMLYEMISGEMPFHNANYNALLQAILHKEPKPTHVLGAGDAELWQIIAKGLAKTKAARWSSMTELGGALAFWLYQHGIKEDLCGNSVRALWLDTPNARIAGPTPLAPVTPAISNVETQPRADAGSGIQRFKWRSGRFVRRRWGLLAMAGLLATLTAGWLFSVRPTTPSAASLPLGTPSGAPSARGAVPSGAVAAESGSLVPGGRTVESLPVEPDASAPATARAASAPREAAVPRQRSLGAASKDVGTAQARGKKTIRDFGF